MLEPAVSRTRPRSPDAVFLLQAAKFLCVLAIGAFAIVVMELRIAARDVQTAAAMVRGARELAAIHSDRVTTECSDLDVLSLPTDAGEPSGVMIDAIPTCQILRLTPPAAAWIEGLFEGREGRAILLENEGPGQLFLRDHHQGSTQLELATGRDEALNPLTTVAFVYHDHAWIEIPSSDP